MKRGLEMTLQGERIGKMLSAVAGIAFLCLTPAGAQKPNVVMIYSDDHGWGDVGYHGYDDVLTPNIDALAAGGTQFSQGYVCASVCGPSRSGMLTGIYQQRVGVYGNYDEGGVPTDQPLIFEMLEREGYQCGVVGKWGIGQAQDALRPNSRGVDFFYGFLGGSHDYYRSGTVEGVGAKNEGPIFRNTEIEPPIQDSGGYLTEMFTKEAVRFIEQAGEEPFCLYLAYNSVHAPWQVPDAYLERVQHLEAHDERKLFAAMLLVMDDGVGALMEALRKKGVADDTLVVFIGDNGSPRGQGIAQPKQKTRGTTTMSSPGPLKGFKGDTYEGGIRVPFVMHWPGRIPAGETYVHPVLNLDVAATVMALCGVEAPWKGHSFDGVDLMPFVGGDKPADERPHEILYWRRGDDYAIRQGDWKLAWNDQGGPPTIQLYNLADDPGEWKDLSASEPERAQTLQNRFDAWDSALADNQSGKNPVNRNANYASGERIDVAEFNAGLADEEGRRSRKAAETGSGKGLAKGRSLKEQLAIAKENSKKNGTTFSAERSTRWFQAKDLNRDGVLDEEELNTKAPVGWNK
jgi:arylsulfatase A-like enzyme